MSSGINTAQAARYEWKNKYGNIGSGIPELEEHLFTSKFRMEPDLGRSRIDAIMTEIKEHKVSPSAPPHLEDRTDNL